MSMNCIFAFSLFLLMLVALNIYFFYTLSTERRVTTYNLPLIKSDPTPPIIKEISEHLNNLPSQYYIKNSKFINVQKSLISLFRSSGAHIKNVWHSIENWADDETLFPYKNGSSGQILHALRTAQIVLVDNAPKGTQLKLLLVLEGQQKLYFKPKRYNLSHVIRGNIYAGYDRHNSEVLTYYLAMVLNYKWIAPSVIRQIHLHKDVLSHATLGLKQTMIKNGINCAPGCERYVLYNITSGKQRPIDGVRFSRFDSEIITSTDFGGGGICGDIAHRKKIVKSKKMLECQDKEKGSMCIYGKCYYCKANETVCPDDNNEIEGAAILYLDKQFKIHKSPWRRSYSSKKMDWETDNDFCNKVTLTLSTKRILNLIDISIIDFLIQNGDRHRYEVYKNRVLLLDNGKGLGNPMVDEMDILAPLYQCCMLSHSTWENLELISGGSLTETIKLLASLHGEKLAAEDHYRAIERRLLKVFATVRYCIGKYGSAKVFKNTK